jgi:uncharacterized membrane protein YGL010W
MLSVCCAVVQVQQTSSGMYFVDSFDTLLEQWCRSLIEQHQFDLRLYQSSHQELKNRWLHKLLIPVECFAAFLFVTAVFRTILRISHVQLHLLMVTCLGFTMGMISLAISPVDHTWTGISSFVFMTASPWISCILVKDKESHKGWRTMAVALVAWILASSLQVAVGHWLWEDNEPDVLARYLGYP